MKLVSQKPVLLCVDIQQGFEDEDYWGGNRNNKDAEEIAAKIINKWREIGEEIIHIRHSSTKPESRLHKSKPGFAFHKLCQPIEGETVLTKSVNSGFIGTPLKEMLDKQNCKSVVVIGLTTDHCVSTTTRMAANYGYNTFLISDATAAFNKIGAKGEAYDSELVHGISLATLKDEFATILSSQELFELL